MDSSGTSVSILRVFKFIYFTVTHRVKKLLRSEQQPNGELQIDFTLCLRLYFTGFFSVFKYLRQSVEILIWARG